jgi:predicted 3-demethylubiquinone-9 3-methyltransferase (glyoxalase superfamily)
MQKISPFLWFDTQAGEAAAFYVSLFKTSKITAITHYGDAGPGPKGSVMTVGFELDGQAFTALNGGPHFTFNEAVSFVVRCDDQAEVDRFWDALTADGGQEVHCGWLKDRFGLSWQIVPAEFLAMASDPDPEKSNRVMVAMMPMKKLDLAKLRAAYEGR